MKPISPKTGQHIGDAQDTADCIELVSFDRLLSEAGRDFFNTARGTLCDYDALTPHMQAPQCVLSPMQPNRPQKKFVDISQVSPRSTCAEEVDYERE